ncbi:MAG TPA: glycosyltransferase family 4 protein [Gemmatimonadaceae bacterium]|nr:glycosyltransferase family 4 protein [Gemmatimonadaceae bacterium]
MLSTPFVAVPPAAYGGTELMIYHLTEGLVQRGHQVTLFATGDSDSSAELRYLYRTAQWPPDPLSDMNHVTWAFSQLRDGDYDLVHAHSAGALACSRLVPWLPVVYTLHHVRQQELSAYYGHFTAPYYVAISHDQARREVPLCRVDVVHHGLDAGDYDCTSEPGRYACFIGRFAPVKGLPTAVGAAAMAGVPIRVAGEAHPVDADYYAREVAPRLAEHHVSFLGSIGLAQKAPLLRDARALLAPIEWNEPFGLVMIEAMLSGCPVVGYARGSIPELVEQGVTGFVVRDQQEMADVIRDGGAAERFDRVRCRARAIERFDASRMVEAYERVYERVMADADPTSDSRVRIA